MFSHIIIFGSSLPEALGGHSLCAIICERVLTNGNGARQPIGRATQSQVRAIFAIARRQQVDPATLVRERFNVERLENLTIREASTLIDDLKRGEVEVRP
jgi:hypothetical protein